MWVRDFSMNDSIDHCSMKLVSYHFVLFPAPVAVLVEQMMTMMLKMMMMTGTHQKIFSCERMMMNLLVLLLRSYLISLLKLVSLMIMSLFDQSRILRKLLLLQLLLLLMMMLMHSWKLDSNRQIAFR